jgi:ATP-dependent RNA helicase DeaD
MTESDVAIESSGFAAFALSEPIQQALAMAGYVTPTPIQAGTIPHLLAGRDVLGQAQTGTGKTAAFGLPLLSNIDVHDRRPQVIVLAPTRELALQVAEELRKFGAKLPGLNVLPIYGGAAYDPQIASLRRGAQVVVGTPGRVMDHLRRGTLQLDAIRALVLDEADEMLKMGFVEDVQWILEHVPEQRQIALFSATMPPAIRQIAHQHLRDPETVSISSRQTGAETIDQRLLVVGFRQKFEATCRILEAETTDGVIIFVKTKLATVELAENLAERGFLTAALNGDMAQNLRQRMVDQFKTGKINVLVATDVAARGLDVERVSHVINYDMPRDSEAYVHRIGRTGRAGRAGCSILYITPREKGFAATIQRATRQPLVPMEIPTAEQINAKRVDTLQKRLQVALSSPTLQQWHDITTRMIQELDQPVERIASALASLALGDLGLMPVDLPRGKSRQSSPVAAEDTNQRPRREKPSRSRDTRDASGAFASDDLSDLIASIRNEPAERNEPTWTDKRSGIKLTRYRIAIGHAHGISPTHIVGAIANETGLTGREIGRIEIEDDHSFVDLPEGMPNELFAALRKTWVMGQPLGISKADSGTGQARSARPVQFDKKPHGKKPFAGKAKKGRSAGSKPFGGKSFAGKDGGSKSTGTAVAAKTRSKPKGKKRPKKEG